MVAIPTLQYKYPANRSLRRQLLLSAANIPLLEPDLTRVSFEATRPDIYSDQARNNQRDSQEPGSKVAPVWSDFHSLSRAAGPHRLW